MSNPCHVLVTGGAGYLGSVLTESLLDGGHEVTVIDSLMYGGAHLLHLCTNSRLRFVHGDARDRRTLEPLIKRADVIIPLAAIVGAPACDRDPRNATSTNLEAIRLMNDLRDASRQLVIYPTTNSGYGTQSGDVYCTEETPLEPISLYGRDKVSAEQELLASPNAITLRLATVFGPSARMRVDLLVNHFVYAAVTDGYLVIFEKDFKRNYVHIRDVSDCFLYCIDNHQRMVGQAYNLGLASANLSKEDLARKVQQQVPGFYLHFASIGSDPDKRNYVVSSEKLSKAGFEARRSIDEGISELIKGYSLFGRHPFKNI